MKTMLVASKVSMPRHNGEEYDSVIEVPVNPDSTNIEPFAASIRNDILRLHDEQVKAGIQSPKVKVFFEAAPPFVTVFKNLKIILGKQFGVDLELPEVFEERPVEMADKETRELLARLDSRK